mmetsp:Transcript_871/g.1345  ORF Transcript_871/g.1345 Transcript_871/m.1345 type:complete len:96 (-) Transcript_871:603-890(-)
MFHIHIILSHSPYYHLKATPVTAQNELKLILHRLLKVSIHTSQIKIKCYVLALIRLLLLGLRPLHFFSLNLCNFFINILSSSSSSSGTTSCISRC